MSKFHEKGDSRQAGVAKRLLVLSLLAGCAHGPNCAELRPLARDARAQCQAHGNLSDENWPLMPVADAACVHLATQALAVCK